MYLLLARATSRIVWPAVAAITSPSMRTFTFSVTAISLSLAAADVAAQASVRLFPRRHSRETERYLGVREHALGSRQFGGHVAAELARRPGRRHLVREGGDQAREPLLVRQPLVDVAGGLLADAHCVRHVRGPGDEVAACIEPLAAGLERVAVDFERAGLLHGQARGLAEVGVDLFAHGQDHAVALDPNHFVRRHRPAAARGVELAELGPDGLDRPHLAVLVAEDAMRSGEIDQLRAFVLGRLYLAAPH